jgi:hypothetical protein
LYGLLIPIKGGLYIGGEGAPLPLHPGNP